MRFLVHGSIAFDQLLGFEGNFTDAIHADDLDALSVSFFAPRFTKHHGGTAANISWNLALLQATPVLVGAVGDDGASYLALLNKRGVDTSLVATLPEHITATAIICTDSGERQIAFFHPGADAHAALPKKPHAADYGIVSARNPILMLSGAEQLHVAKVPFLFDPGQQTHVLPRDAFRRAVRQSSGLVVNAYEWDLARDILQWQEADVVEACGLLVVTLGEHGARAVTREGVTDVAAARPEHVVNPTGAGDAFRAGFLVGLAQGWELSRSLQLAATIASFVVEQEGAFLSELDPKAFAARAEAAYGASIML